MMTLNKEERIQDLNEQIDAVTERLETARREVKHCAHRFNVLTEILSDLILEDKE